jgi:hypothetical protein
LEVSTFSIPQIPKASTKQCAVDTVNRSLYADHAKGGHLRDWCAAEDAHIRRIRITLTRHHTVALGAEASFVAFDQLMRCLDDVGAGLNAQEIQVSY